MTIRTKHTIVRFRSPFTLPGIAGVQPPGEYDIDHDEDLIDGVSWIAYRRVASFIHIPAIGAKTRSSQLLAIDPLDLEAALRHDQDETV